VQGRDPELDKLQCEWHVPLPQYPPPSPSLLFVLSGPSGVGKDAVISRLKQENLPLHFTVTATTRPIRRGEVHGVNYYFVTVERFNDLIARGELLEWANVHGNLYGTPITQVREALASGKDVLLKIDVQGAAQVKRRVPDAVFIFLGPPDIQSLISRLSQRGTESPEEVARRIADACEEMRHLPEYDYLVINPEQQLEEAVQKVKAIITAEKCRVKPREIRID